MRNTNKELVHQKRIQCEKQKCFNHEESDQKCPIT
jgi:hypothetical protein